MKKLFEKNEIIKEVVIYTASYLAPFLFLFLADIRNKFIYFNFPLLLIILLFILIIPLLTIFQRKVTNGIHLILNIFPTLSLIICVSIFPKEVLMSQYPLFVPLAFFMITKLIEVESSFNSYVNEAELKNRLGYAATGVLIDNSNHGNESFILVNNLNLRNGTGLWVPPGGHFNPYLQDPTVRLRQKIKEEVGYLCEIYNPYTMNLPQDLSDFDTTDVKWIIPPVFLLKEKMMDICSHNHLQHFDLIYICIGKDEPDSDNAKYPESERLTIPIKNCMNSYDETERNINLAIDDWHRKHRRKKPTTRHDITKDLIWRLHLSAQIYNSRKS